MERAKGMVEARGIAFTSVEYVDSLGNRHKLNVTVRDGGYQEGRDSLDALKVIVEEEVQSQLERLPSLDDVPEVEFGKDPFPVNPSEYGVVDRLMAAGDWEPGDTQEILVTEYERAGDAIKFFKDDYEHAVHTHYINNKPGTDMMTHLFTDVWSYKFPIKGKVKFPGGDMIIKIEGSNKRRDSGGGKGNVFRNLIGARRP